MYLFTKSRYVFIAFWAAAPGEGCRIERWHDTIGDPTYADAILDRLVHNAYRIELRGDSMRRRNAWRTITADGVR